MIRTALICLLLAIAGATRVSALDMNVALDAKEKLVYMNLWGKIEHGDDQKFRSTLLPYIRSGNMLWEVNVLTIGGDVDAAMGIGDQIRTAKGTTIAPMRMAQYVDRRSVPTGHVQCWFFSSIGGNVASNWPNNQFDRDTRTNRGAAWCDCASACFLIWSSGLTRIGQWVGVHRFKFDEVFYGSLPAAKAETLYSEVEKKYTAYLRNLDVAGSILDRLYATPSTGMYYLSPSELELVRSTPYLEELVLARCGSSKARCYWQGTNHICEEDAQHITCTRNALKEIKASGAKAYLAKYGP